MKIDALLYIIIRDIYLFIIHILKLYCILAAAIIKTHLKVCACLLFLLPVAVVEQS